MVFGHLVPHDYEESVFKHSGQLVKTRFSGSVHRQTLPVLAQTWTASFFIGMTAYYENVEMNIT